MRPALETVVHAKADMDYPRGGVPVGGLILLQHPHIRCMAQWQPPKREPAKTKAELREMLTQAVRNTAQPEAKRPPKIKRDRGKKAA